MPPALQREAALPPATSSSARATSATGPSGRGPSGDPALSAPAPPDAAFLLSADGRMRRLAVPLDALGRPFKLGSVGWRLFVQDALNVEFTVDGSELPRPPFEEWAAADDFRLPAQIWDLSAVRPETADPQCSAHATAPAPTFNMVKIFQWPYIDWEHYNNVLPFNKVAPLFTDSAYWRGDMLLVCYEYRPAFLYDLFTSTIVSPAELLAQVPAALRDFWHVDLEALQAMLLAFAMLTHKRLGTQACARALDDNLVHMVLDMALPHWPSFSTQDSPKDTWDLRALFHAMAKADYFSDDEEDFDNFSGENELEDEDGADEL